jgi:RimJ/RimL family protein N-acetyltransferase
VTPQRIAPPKVAPLGTGTLTGRFIALEPIEERHHAALKEAGGDPELFRFVPSIGDASDFERWISLVESATEKGTRIAYAVRRLADGAIVGSSSYLDILEADGRVEIGSTWYTTDVHGTAVNPEAKLLLLGNAFRAGYNCVFLKTDARNARSRAAILKLGAKQDGILRGHLWNDRGYFRDSVYFSILAAEWPNVKAGLEARLAAFA